MIGKELRDKGCAKVRENIPEDWKMMVDGLICAMASSGKKFTAEDIRTLSGDPPNHPNAMGAMFMVACQRGIIERCGDILAKRKNRHAARIGLYVGRREI